jgi:hypothetical protein
MRERLFLKFFLNAAAGNVSYALFVSLGNPQLQNATKTGKGDGLLFIVPILF